MSDKVLRAPDRKGAPFFSTFICTALPTKYSVKPNTSCHIYKFIDVTAREPSSSVSNHPSLTNQQAETHKLHDRYCCCSGGGSQLTWHWI
jgi:hypothetical protein